MSSVYIDNICFILFFSTSLVQWLVCLLARSGPTKEYKIGICCFSPKHAILRRKSKGWLGWNRNDVSE